MDHRPHPAAGPESRSPRPAQARRGFRSLLRLTIALAMAAGALASPALATPDLVIQNLSLDPSSGPNGTAVTISAKVRNQGDTAAGASVTRIRINQSSSSVGSGDTTLCSSLATPALAAGASADVSCKPTLTQRPGGVNYIWAIADPNHDSGETNTTNSRSNTQFTVSEEAADLIVQNVTLTPVSVPNGSAVNISVTIKNQGAGSAASSVTRVRINADPSTVSSADPQICNFPATAALAPGASVVVSCVPTVSGRPAGVNYVWAIADVNKTAGQSDFSNDRGSAPLTISSESSDLVVDLVTLDPTAGPNGEQVTVTAVIRNQGNTTALASKTRVRINTDPTTVGGNDPEFCIAIQMKTIAAGASAEISCKATLEDRPPGSNLIWVVADSTNTAGQSDRSNDRLSAEFIVDPLPVPDLTVRTLTVNPLSGSSGALLTITAKIANDGKVAAPASKTRFVINQDPETVADGDTVLCDQVNTVALNKNGASTTINCKPVLGALPAGPSFVWAIVDATGVTGQNNVENDLRSAPFTVIGEPVADLVVQGLAIDPATGPAGTSASITATIKNQGNLAAPATTTRIQLSHDGATVLETDPVLCDALPTAALAAGASTTVSCGWTVGDEVPGPLFVWATADTTATSGQTDTSNDTGKATFLVIIPDGPDLTIQRLVVRPTTAGNGDSIVVKARVENIGNLAAAASVTTFRINLSPGTVGDADQALCTALPTRALAVGEGVRVRCATKLVGRPDGVNSVWAIVDTSATSGQVTTSNDRRRAELLVSTATCTNPLEPPVMEWPIEQPRVLQDYATFGSVPLAGGKIGYHAGIDLKSHLSFPSGAAPVYAAADGELVASKTGCPSPADAVADPPNGKCAGGWGNYLVIRHGAGIYSVYAHLGQVFQRKGCVSRGDRIALAGSSGSTTLPVHLHFGVIADLTEPVPRKALGTEYYKKSHPFEGYTPENASGSRQIHLDARDFMPRVRIRLNSAATASRGTVTGGAVAYLAQAQEYISYGELVPGFYCIDLPNPALPEDGAPYADEARYGWVATSKADVIDEGLMPGSVRVDGYGAFVQEGVGANFVALRDQATASSAEVSKAWGDQQFAPSGNTIIEAGTGKPWQPVYVPGTAATGANGPRQAYLPVALLGPPPGH